MNQIRNISTKSVVFSRWSGKNFAIFSSLKKVVHIGRLGVAMCESVEFKNSGLIKVLQLLFSIAEAEEETDDDVALILQQEGLCVLAADPFGSQLLENRSHMKPVFCLVRNTGFFYLDENDSGI